MEHDSQAVEPGKMAHETEVAPSGGTGDLRVDAAIAGLDELGELPVSEHPPVFERIHGQLVEVLGELHVGAGPAEPLGDRDDLAEL